MKSILIAAIAFALAGCKGDASIPTGFGVNVTVDSSALSADQRKGITSFHVTASGDTGASPIDVAIASLGPKFQFRYIPGVKTGTISLVVEARAVNLPVASGVTDAINVGATAENATITLTVGKGRGTACVVGTDCAEGHCVDGVCCNTACDGVCESCALATDGNVPGFCNPIAADSDPESECGGTVPDAGVPENMDDGGTVADGGDDEDGGYNFPDGGVTPKAASCGGSCNGSRACKYAAKDTNCGTVFCNTNGEVAGLACDGAGLCTIAKTECTGYVCAEGVCKTSCATQADCQITSYCNGSTCAPRKANSITCVASYECTSGFCANGFCCESACTDVAGGTCGASGKEGQCTCPACSTGPCAVFYQDQDGDGFGDKFATVGMGAKVACADAMTSNPSSVSGFVLDNTDCYDHNPNAKPGQTAYFGTDRGDASYDYDCDGSIEKYYPEVSGGACKFCGAPGSCASSTATCAVVNTQSKFQCVEGGAGSIFSCASACSSSCYLRRFGPNALLDGFSGTVNCGAYASYHECGKCTVAGGAAADPQPFTQQTCR